MRMKHVIAVLLAAVSFSAAAVIPASVQIELVEFYHKELDHYFVTTEAKEDVDLNCTCT